MFFLIYALTGSLYAGVALAVAIGLAQVIRRRLSGRAVEPLQWMSLALVVVLVGATVLIATPRLIMLKPSIAHFAVAAIMLRRGWMRRYMPPIVQQHVPAAVVDAAGHAWATLLATLGGANIAVALTCSVATWAWFISFGAIGAKVLALLVQYTVFRRIVTRRVRAAAAAAAAA